MFCVFVLLSAVFTTFAQTFLLTTQRLNILQPNSASASSNITPEDISAFSQLKQVDINSPFFHIFKYSADSDDTNNDKNDNNSDIQFQQTVLNDSLQNQSQHSSDTNDLNDGSSVFKYSSDSDDVNNDRNDNNADSQFQQTGLNDSLQNQLHPSDTDDGSINNIPDSQLDDFNSPILSEFAEYNLQVQKYANIYPRLYDFSFSPDILRECFYNEAIYFALENGLYEVGSLPQQLADAAAQAIPSLTPLDYFAALSNTLELSLRRGGIAIDKNYQAMARLNAKDLEVAMEFIKVNNAQTSLHAIIVGTGTFFKSLNLDSPDEIKYILSTWADQLSKVPKAGNGL